MCLSGPVSRIGALMAQNHQLLAYLLVPVLSNLIKNVLMSRPSDLICRLAPKDLLKYFISS